MMCFCQTWIGIDISRYQNKILWDTSINFVFVKATEGINLRDKKFKSHWESVPTNIHKGAYHFFRPSKSGKSQADFFLRVANLRDNNLVPVIDVEPTRDHRRTKPKIGCRNLKEMILQIQKKTGCTPIIYTSKSLWERYYHSYFKDFNIGFLWVADYHSIDTPLVPCTWDSWTIWQWTQTGKIDGYNRCIDKSICRIDPECLTIYNNRQIVK